MTDILAEICAAKRKHIARRKTEMPETRLMASPLWNEGRRGFKNALTQKTAQGKFALIAEIKKASPSKGIIREDFDPATLAQAYETGGATCLSVLTDTPYFQGHDNYLMQARSHATLPLLRKDFMLDAYQVVESRAIGADCILLIMAALGDSQAKDLEDAAMQLGIDVLVEVHNRSELDRALQINAHNTQKMIGINNRNLKTLEVDLSTSETLAKHLPQHILAVCESGISTHADLEHMKKAGISCFLVGESLMRETDVTKATQHLLGATHG